MELREIIVNFDFSGEQQYLCVRLVEGKGIEEGVKAWIFILG